MKRPYHVMVAVLFCLGISQAATAQTTATQNVTVVVESVNAISVSSGSLTLTINSATPGTGLTAATNNATTYSVTTNGTALKVTGILNQAYAAGIALSATLGAPAGATATQRTLTTSALDLVTGITKLSASGLTITYSATATESALPNGPGGETNTVTLTITS